MSGISLWPILAFGLPGHGEWMFVAVAAIAMGVVIMVTGRRRGRKWWWLGLVVTILGVLGFLAYGFPILMLLLAFGAAFP